MGTEKDMEKKKGNRKKEIAENKHNARKRWNDDQYTSTEQNELDARTSKS